MIKDESFSKQWILGMRQKAEYRKSHPELMEKMIYALYLVEKLSEQNISFVFKGGTCLTLLFPKLTRFSIDVDIIAQINAKTIEDVLKIIVRDSKFSRFERDEKRSYADGFPKAHYELFFVSEYDDSEKNILLDVVFDESPYRQMVGTEIKNDFLNIDAKPTTIEVPSVNSLTGDKLTAFAPNTIGIPYNKEKNLQIIKQLFDLGLLYNVVDDLSIVYVTFKKICEAQFGYQNKKLTVEEVLNDIIDTAFLLGMGNKNKGDDKVKYDELFDGVNKFKTFLPLAKYSVFDAVEAASKAALIASKLLVGDFNPLPGLNPINYKPDQYKISNVKFTPLQKMIKGLPNLTLFYWYNVSELLNESKGS